MNPFAVDAHLSAIWPFFPPSVRPSECALDSSSSPPSGLRPAAAVAHHGSVSCVLRPAAGPVSASASWTRRGRVRGRVLAAGSCSSRTATSAPSPWPPDTTASSWTARPPAPRSPQSTGSRMARGLCRYVRGSVQVYRCVCVCSLSRYQRKTITATTINK